MSTAAPDRRDRADLDGRLETYYVRYYRDALGIPDWRALVAVRLDDDAYEGRRLARLEAALGEPVRGRRLLNVGCGPGGFNVVAERAGAVAWGIDPSADAAAIAARRGPSGRVVQATGEHLPFRDAAFDVVYCYSTLEHVEDPVLAVTEMLRVLAPSGRLYLHTPNRWSWFEGHYKLLWVPGLGGGAGRLYLALRGRPTAFLSGVRPLSWRQCARILERAGAGPIRILDDDADRPVGGALWPAIRCFYRILRVRPTIELVAGRRTARG